MDIQQASSLASSAVTAAIPLMFAGVGELVTENQVCSIWASKA